MEWVLVVGKEIGDGLDPDFQPLLRVSRERIVRREVNDFDGVHCECLGWIVSLLSFARG
jgi:hypothetical protein